jgi:hypothetical protein
MLALLILVLSAPPAAAKKVDLHQVDWANRAYEAEGKQVTLTKGNWETYDEAEGFGESLDLFGVKYVDLDGDGTDEAVVGLTYWGGGTGKFDSLTVFRAGAAGPEVMGRIPGGDRADGGLAGFSVEKAAVRVGRMHALPTGGACCPDFVTRELWRWQAGKMVEVPDAVGFETFAEDKDAKGAQAGLEAGRKATKAGDSESAVAGLLDALAKKPGDATILGELGFAMKKAGWTTEARLALRATPNATGPDKVKGAALYNLGRLELDAGDAAAAVAAFERSLKLRPGNAPTEKALQQAKAKAAKP